MCEGGGEEERRGERKVGGGRMRVWKNAEVGM